MKYIWVISLSGVAFVLTSILRWYKSVSLEPISQSNDPYVFLFMVIAILHFYYIIQNLDAWLRKAKVDNKIIENKYVGYIVVLGLIILVGVIGSIFVDIFLY